MGLSTEAGLLSSTLLQELGLARPGLVFARTFGFAIALTLFFAASHGAIAHVPALLLVERVAKALLFPFGPLAIGAGALAAAARWRFLVALEREVSRLRRASPSDESRECSVFAFPQSDVRLAGRTTVMIVSRAADGRGTTRIAMWAEAGMPALSFGALARAVRSGCEWRRADPSTPPCLYQVVRLGFATAPVQDAIVEVALLETDHVHYVVRRSRAGRLYASRHPSREEAEAELARASSP